MVMLGVNNPADIVTSFTKTLLAIVAVVGEEFICGQSPRPLYFPERFTKEHRPDPIRRP